MALSKSDMLAMIEANRAKKAAAITTTTENMKGDNTTMKANTTTEAKKAAAITTTTENMKGDNTTMKANTTTEAKKAAAKKAAPKKATAADQAAAITTTEAKSEALFTFTSKRIYVNENGYELTRYGFDKDMSVYAFANIDGLGVRFHIGVNHEQYTEAKKAAETFEIMKAAADQAEAKITKSTPKKAAAAITTTTTENMKGDNTTMKANTTTEAKKAAAKKAAPKKAAKTLAEYIANGINGNGWKFVFDEAASRTRLVFDIEPTAKQLEAISEAGFYYSKQMNSYNKKLTMKAAAAAEELAKKL